MSRAMWVGAAMWVLALYCGFVLEDVFLFAILWVGGLGVFIGDVLGGE